jgi:hypothetical protein
MLHWSKQQSLEPKPNFLAAMKTSKYLIKLSTKHKARKCLQLVTQPTLDVISRGNDIWKCDLSLVYVSRKEREKTRLEETQPDRLNVPIHVIVIRPTGIWPNSATQRLAFNDTLARLCLQGERK